MMNLNNLMMDSLLSENLQEQLSKVQQRKQEKMQASLELQELARQQMMPPPRPPQVQQPRPSMFDTQPVQKTAPVQPMAQQPPAPTQPAPALPAGPEATLPSAPPELSSEGAQAQNMETLRDYHETLLPEGQEFGFESNWSGQSTMYGGPGMSESQDWIDSIDYAKGSQGKTIGNITGAGGDKDHWGRDVEWSEGTIYEGNKLGDVISTPAGDYLVVNAADGQLALKPLKGAKHGGGQFFFNMTNKGHHVGINPLTGDVWYQAAPSVQEIEGVDYLSSLAWDPEYRDAVRRGDEPIPTQVRRAYQPPQFSSFSQGLSGLGDFLNAFLYGQDSEASGSEDVPESLFGEILPKG